jgi:hypothetical protein
MAKLGIYPSTHPNLDIYPFKFKNWVLIPQNLGYLPITSSRIMDIINKEEGFLAIN